MEKTLLERLKDVKHDYDIVHVCFFNDGSTRQEEKYFAERINRSNTKDQYNAIEEVLYKATSGYARNFDFNDIEIHLLIGLIFHKSDITEDNSIKPGAQPIPDMVRYYTGSVKSYLDDKQTNTVDYEQYGVGRQGYVNFNQLVALMKSSELTYNGPESFEEFKERILRGEVFDISLSADLRQPEDTRRTFVKK